MNEAFVILVAGAVRAVEAPREAAERIGDAGDVERLPASPGRCRRPES